MSKRKKREKKVINDNLYHCIDAMSDMADDMPDGAWWAMLEDSVTEYNRANGTRYDENDAVHAYLERRHEEVNSDEKDKASG